MESTVTKEKVTKAVRTPSTTFQYESTQLSKDFRKKLIDNDESLVVVINRLLRGYTYSQDK